MAGALLRLPGSCRPVWPVIIILAAAPRLVNGSEGPAAPGRESPRGKHWAVGHLMGKKSVVIVPELQETFGDFLKSPAGPRGTEPDRNQRLMEALMQHKRQKQTAQTKSRLFGLGGA
ncbi:gastrin-releasing peptide [Antennarius striatus]|uniref:gastrin-releasing peptide n=1 Tax=Antennarius striatus TaxID=241820 RepID=UPI0035B274A5